MHRNGRAHTHACGNRNGRRDGQADGQCGSRRLRQDSADVPERAADWPARGSLAGFLRVMSALNMHCSHLVTRDTVALTTVGGLSTWHRHALSVQACIDGARESVAPCHGAQNLSEEGGRGTHRNCCLGGIALVGTLCSVDVRLVSNQERATQAYAWARTSFRTTSVGWRNPEAVTLLGKPVTAIVRFAWAATVENKHAGPASAQRVYPATSPAGSLHRTKQTPTSADEESEEGDEEARERRAHHLVQN